NLLRSRALRPNPVKVLQRRGVLANLKFQSLSKTPIPQSDEVQRLRIAARACRRLVSKGSRPLIFTGTVAGGIALTDVLQSIGISGEMVHSEMSKGHRRGVIAAFAAGRVAVLVNQRLLATGYDCPAVSDVLILSKVQSPILFEQI